MPSYNPLTDASPQVSREYQQKYQTFVADLANELGRTTTNPRPAGYSSFQQGFQQLIESCRPHTRAFKVGLKKLLEAFPTAKTPTAHISWSNGQTKVMRLREVVPLSA